MRVSGGYKGWTKELAFPRPNGESDVLTVNIIWCEDQRVP